MSTDASASTATTAAVPASTGTLRLTLDSYSDVAGSGTPQLSANGMGLQNLVSTGSVKAFRASDHLTPARHQAAQAAAAQLVGQVLGPPGLFIFYQDPSALAELHSEALAPLNTVVDDIYNAMKRGDVPPMVKAYLQTLQRTMKGIQGKYSNDPNVETLHDHIVGTVAHLFHQAHDLMFRMWQDMESARQTMDAIGADVMQEQRVLRGDVHDLSNLEDVSEKVIDRFVYDIAVMEFVLDAMRARAAQAKTDLKADDPLYDKKQTQIMSLQQAITILAMQVDDYHQRYVIALATPPQLFNIRFYLWGLAVRLGEIINTTIPVMKLFIVEMAAARQAAKVAGTIEAIDDFEHEVIQSAGAQMVAANAAAGAAMTRPGISGQDMMTVVGSLAQQATETLHYMALAEQQHAMSDQTVEAARQSIRGTKDQLAAGVDHVTDLAAAGQIQLPPPPDPGQLPSVIQQALPRALALPAMPAA